MEVSLQRPIQLADPAPSARARPDRDRGLPVSGLPGRPRPSASRAQPAGDAFAAGFIAVELRRSSGRESTMSGAMARRRPAPRRASGRGREKVCRSSSRSSRSSLVASPPAAARARKRSGEARFAEAPGQRPRLGIRTSAGSRRTAQRAPGPLAPWPSRQPPGKVVDQASRTVRPMGDLVDASAGATSPLIGEEPQAACAPLTPCFAIPRAAAHGDRRRPRRRSRRC